MAGKDDFEAKLQRALAATPRVPGVDWSMALSVAVLRELDTRLPGFGDAIRTRLEVTAAAMEVADDADMRADAPSVRELAASWVFKTASVAGQR